MLVPEFSLVTMQGLSLRTNGSSPMRMPWTITPPCKCASMARQTRYVRFHRSRRPWWRCGAGVTTLACQVNARVIAIGHDSDTALLTVDDNDEFWDGLGFLELGGLPELQARVTVVGYPTGGDNISVTAGVVSRVELHQYSMSMVSLLAIQIDAAINSGNSGGPAFHNGKVAGIAFETLEGAEGIGYIIPAPVVQHFLEDVRRQTKPRIGFGRLGFQWQAIEVRGALVWHGWWCGVYPA